MATMAFNRFFVENVTNKRYFSDLPEAERRACDKYFKASGKAMFDSRAFNIQNLKFPTTLFSGRRTVLETLFNQLDRRIFRKESCITRSVMTSKRCYSKNATLIGINFPLITNADHVV
jgi:hypothetical protein